MLYELLYTSHANQDLSDEDLAQLLDQSRKRNATIGISGLLIYHNQEFVQLLEGEKDQVQALYDRIALDDRHSSVRTFWDGEIERRNFRNWAMAYIDTRKLDLSNLDWVDILLKKNISLEDLTYNDADNVGKDLIFSLGDQVFRRNI